MDLENTRKVLLDDNYKKIKERLSLDYDNADTDKIIAKLTGIFQKNIAIDENELLSTCKGSGGLCEACQRVVDLFKNGAHGDISINEEIIGTVLEVVEELGKCKEYRTRAIKAERKIEVYESFFDEFKTAWKEYNSDEHTRWDQRAKAFFKSLGLTTGKRQEKTDKRFMFYEYMELIHDSWDMVSNKRIKKVSKQKALEILAKKYKTSSDACLEQLMTYVRRAKKQLKEDEDEELEGYRDLFFDIRLKRKKECDLSQEEKQALNTKWEHVKEKLKKEDWITSGFKKILPGKNPYKK